MYHQIVIFFDFLNIQSFAHIASSCFVIRASVKHSNDSLYFSLSSRIELVARISSFQATLLEKSSSFQDESLREINASITQKLFAFSRGKHGLAASPTKANKPRDKIELSQSSNTYQLQEVLCLFCSCHISNLVHLLHLK